MKYETSWIWGKLKEGFLQCQGRRKALSLHPPLDSLPTFSPCVCIASQLCFHIAVFPTAHSPPGVISGPVTQRRELFVIGNTEIWGSGDDGSRIQHGDLLWDRRQEWQACFCAKVSIGKRRKDLLGTPSFLPQAYSQSKGFSHEWWIGLGAADRANSLKFKAHCSLCRLGGCRKLPETCSGCVALCHKQLFQPGCDPAAQRTAHWAVLALTITCPPQARTQAWGGHLWEGTRWHQSGKRPEQWERKMSREATNRIWASLHCHPKP